MTIQQARAADLIPLTEPYEPTQLWMARAAMQNLRKGGIRCELVQIGTRFEVWRQKPAWRPVPAKEYGYHILRK